MSATKAPKPFAEMSAGELADLHRGHSFAKRRAADELSAIEAELERRGADGAVRGTLALLEKKPTVLLDLERLRAERPDIVTAYGKGPGGYWSSRTLKPEERG